MTDLDKLPPLPWTAVKVFENGWGFTVLDANGVNIADREVWIDDAALMATIHAFGPLFLRYVEAASEKGGAEAKALIERFKRARSEIEKSPEQITAMRRRRVA